MPGVERGVAGGRAAAAGAPRGPAATGAAELLRHWRRVPPSRAPLHPRWIVRAGRVAAGSDGPKVRALEEDLAARLAARYEAREVFLTDSGTTALTVALAAALRVQGGSRIAVPAYTCFSVATAVAGARGDAFLYDLVPETLSPAAPSVEEALRNGIQVLVACPLYGYPVDVPALMEQADRYGAIVVEDAAQGMGATLRGRPSGAFAPLSVLSFGRGKGISCGGGGALVVRDPDFLPMARAAARRLGAPTGGWAELARSLAEWLFGRPALYRIPSSLPFLGLGETRYAPPAPGRAIAAGAVALLREALLGGTEGEEAERRRRAERLRSELSGVDRVAPVRPIPSAVPGELRLPLLLGGARGGGAPDLGVMPGYPSTLDRIPRFRPHVLWTAPSLEGASRLVRSLVTAPTHRWVPPDLGPRVAEWAGQRPEPRPSRSTHSRSSPSIPEVSR